jgi:hypothetical protein
MTRTLPPAARPRPRPRADADRVVRGEEFGVVRGSARSILVAERIALNFMQVGAVLLPDRGGQGQRRQERAGVQAARTASAAYGLLFPRGVDTRLPSNAPPHSPAHVRHRDRDSGDGGRRGRRAHAVSPLLRRPRRAPERLLWAGCGCCCAGSCQASRSGSCTRLHLGAQCTIGCGRSWPPGLPLQNLGDAQDRARAAPA